MIPIPIYLNIGSRHVADLQGAVWKVVHCEACNEQFAYLLEIEASGEYIDLLDMDGADAKALAQAKAKEQFLSQTRNAVLPVPCPQCGIYQQEMAKLLKGEASINQLQIAGFAIILLAFVPLVLNMPYIWVLTVIIAIMGLGLLMRGYQTAFRFDPNAGDPEPRKAIGRSCAVWGTQLTKLMAAQNSEGQECKREH